MVPSEKYVNCNFKTNVDVADCDDDGNDDVNVDDDDDDDGDDNDDDDDDENDDDDGDDDGDEQYTEDEVPMTKLLLIILIFLKLNSLI